MTYQGEATSLESQSREPKPSAARIALIGNPNVGKTSVFNRLTTLRAKTSNFSGTTVQKRTGTVRTPSGGSLTLVDLPGLFSLDAQSPDERVAKRFLEGNDNPNSRPEAVAVVVDATNLERSLFVAGEAIQLGLPTLIVVNMIEAARSRGIEINADLLAKKLGCPVVTVSARTGEGFDQLRSALAPLVAPTTSLPIIAEELCTSCGTCPYAHGHQWAAGVARDVSNSGELFSAQTADRVDRTLTHPILGIGAFGLIMVCLFALVFWLASYPMDWLDGAFGQLAAIIGTWLPDNDFRSLLTDGVIAGVGGVVVFLPQICILFFVLSVLEDSGYLSRAVVVVDRWMSKVGLPGQAFVPLLAAHACAIPAIMATKTIESRRDRLAAILVIPLMTCSARLPVYSIIAAMLFPESPLRAALLFASAYVLGMVAAFGVAWLLKRTILPGEPTRLLLDLPPYRRPSIRNAARTAYERGKSFLREAGTVILVISMAIWFFSTYPKLPDAKYQQSVATANAAGADINADDENVQQRLAQEYSMIGRAGKFVEPIFRPLGFDWKTSVGVLTSFAAREVVVSTLSVLYGLGDEPEDETSLREKLSTATREDGTLVFDTPTCISLLVFFVLAMQCLPTQAVTRRETGSWKWAIFQLVYMTLLAYGMAFVAYRVAGAFC